MSGKSGVIAAGHDVTAQAGEAILRAGGNAYDAIIAASAAACVAEPVLTSAGGGGFLLAAREDEKPLIYDFFVQTSKQKKPDQDLDFYPINADFGGTVQEFHIGMASSAVPGMVQGWFEIHKDLGSMPMKEILAPAARAARDGIAVNAYQAYLFGVVQDIFKAGALSKSIYGSTKENGALVREGETQRNPQLADFFETLALEGSDLFYRGEVGQQLVSDMEAGGLITADDLLSYEVKRRKPLELHYHDTYIEMNPPPATGGLLIAFGLKLIEEMGVQNMKPGSEDYLMLMADVLAKTSQARVEIEAEQCEQGQAAMVLDETFLSKYREDVMTRAKVARGTTHISVIDKDKNMASMTVSNGEGNGYVVPGAGIVMNNMLGEEDLNPGGFHQWEPNTRLSSMMTPTTVLWPDGKRMALGSGGSNRIRTAILQLLVNLVEFDMHAEEAVDAPRIHLEGDGPLNVEGGFEDDLEQLHKAYPDLNRWEDMNMFFGGTHVVGVDKDGFEGAGDPRRSGVCRVL